MLTLSADLLAAQKAPTAVPVVQVVARHAEAGQYLPRWEQIYAAAGSDYHAAAVTASGALIRVITNSAAVLNERSVIDVNGNPEFPFGTTFVNMGAARSTSGCAIATVGTEVLIYAVSANGLNIQEFRSTDSGLNYAAPVTRFTETKVITHLAAVAKPGGEVALLWNTGGGDVDATDAALFGARRSAAGTWSAKVTSPVAMRDCFGVAVCTPPTGMTNFGVVTCGRTPNSGATPLAPRMWGENLTDADPPAFQFLIELEKAESGLVEKFEFHRPFLHTADASRSRLTYRRAYLGTGSGKGIADSVITHLPALHGVAVRRWRQPTVVDDNQTAGLAISGPGGTNFLWLTSSGRVYRAPAVMPSYDLSNDVIALSARWGADGGSLDLTLSNPKTEYNVLSDGSDNPFASLTTGSELSIALGYRTPAGTFTSEALPLYRVERIDRVYGGGRHTVQVRAREAFHQLQRWRNPTQIIIPPNTDNLFEVLKQIAAKAGGYTVTGSSSALAARLPQLSFGPDFRLPTPPRRFTPQTIKTYVEAINAAIAREVREDSLTLNANETGRAIVAKLVDKVPQAIFERRGVLTLRDIDAAEAAVYSYRTGP